MGGSRRIAFTSDEEGQARVAWILFAAAAAASIAVIAVAGSGQALKGDEWGIAYRLATESLPHAILHAPPGKYLIVLPMIFYKVAFSTVGIGDYLPYRVVGMALTVATAALFLILAARRVGPLMALPGAVLILFLGSSGEVTATALRIPTQVALVAGLGMLLFLERRDLRADIAACALLFVSITSHPLGTAFAAAAVVLVLSRPAPERWRRAWVFGAPLVLFALWYVTLREPFPVGPSLGDQLRDLPRFEVQSLAVMAAAATGVFHWPTGDFLTPLSYAIAGAIVGVTAAIALTRRMPAEFWAVLAVLIVLFGAPSFAPGGVRSPEAGRYIFPGVVMLLVLFAELVGGVRLATPRARVAAGAVAAVLLFATVCNAIVLDRTARRWAAAGSWLRAELTALDLEREHVDPGFQLELPALLPPDQPKSFFLPAGKYFPTASAFGSPAFTPARLRSEPAPLRQAADVALARALALQLVPVLNRPSTHNPPPRAIAPTGAVRRSAPGCATIRSGGSSPSLQLELPPRGVALVGTNQPMTRLALARFGDSYSVPLEPVGSTRIAELRIPPDADPMPWRLSIRGSSRPIEACGL